MKTTTVTIADEVLETYRLAKADLAVAHAEERAERKRAGSSLKAILAAHKYQHAGLAIVDAVITAAGGE